MNSMKRQNDRILKEKLPRSVGAQIATGDQWRNNSRKNEGMEPKQKQYHKMGCNGKYFLDGTVVKNPCAVQERQVQSLGWKDAVEKEVATHSRILAWRIPMDRETW